MGSEIECLHTQKNFSCEHIKAHPRLRLEAYGQSKQQISKDAGKHLSKAGCVPKGQHL